MESVFLQLPGTKYAEKMRTGTARLVVEKRRVHGGTGALYLEGQV
jgi:hypothetical protein